jgi:hypothetical protein
MPCVQMVSDGVARSLPPLSRWGGSWCSHLIRVTLWYSWDRYLRRGKKTHYTEECESVCVCVWVRMMIIESSRLVPAKNIQFLIHESWYATFESRIFDLTTVKGPWLIWIKLYQSGFNTVNGFSLTSEFTSLFLQNMALNMWRLFNPFAEAIMAL